MIRIRFISQQPLEVLGQVRFYGDVLEVEDPDVAADLLRRADVFEREDALDD